MYNSIYPVNINYRKYGQYPANNTSGFGSQNVQKNQNSQITHEENNQQNNTFPNGQKTSIDYTKGKINISQVLTDFRSTILAINAPDDIRDEVNAYLNLVEKESKKETPSKEIILTNLKNASKVSDTFIESVLGKHSNVVENWISTLFLQNINIKADPSEINPDFQLKFPQKSQAKIEQAQQENPEEQTKIADEDEKKELKITNDNEYLKEALLNTQKIETKTIQTQDEKPQIESPDIEIESTIELNEAQNNTTLQNNQDEISDNERIVKETKITPFSPKTKSDKQARTLFMEAKNAPNTKAGDISRVNYLNEALGILAKDENANPNIKAAIHLERGKVFDNYDYIDYALRDYFEATKASDFNLKANAHYKSGEIYDEFGKFHPALDNYISSVAYSGEADNKKAQAKVLNKISSLYTKQYDLENTSNYAELALNSANDTQDKNLIANTYSNAAKNYQYLGENELALNGYKNALKEYFSSDKKEESYVDMAYNYEQAAIVMESLGNNAKAMSLRKKALLYHQKAQQNSTQQVV